MGCCIHSLVESMPNDSAGTVRKPRRRIVDLGKHLGPSLLQRTPARPSFVPSLVSGNKARARTYVYHRKLEVLLGGAKPPFYICCPQTSQVQARHYRVMRDSCSGRIPPCAFPLIKLADFTGIPTSAGEHDTPCQIERHGGRV